MVDHFALDSEIRSGVTIPIVIIVILSAVLRRYVAIILNSDGPKQKTNLQDVQSSQLVSRSRLLRDRSSLLPPRSFYARRLQLTKGEGGLSHPPQQLSPLQAMAASQSGDPSATVSMLKNQMAFVILSGGLGYLISALFTGFLVARAPFPLPYKFKSMLQRGTDVPGLDANFVSSLSWYFFVLLSSSGVLMLIHHLLGDDSVDDVDSGIGGMMMPGLGMGQMAGGPAGNSNPLLASMGGGPDMKKVFQMEKETLELIEHRSLLPMIKRTVMSKFI